jgi:GNAT superfamily N-acetyltransferase
LSTLRVSSLDAFQHRGEFACGKTPLDRFLHDQAFDWERRDLTRSFVLVPTDDPQRILGYYALSVTAVDQLHLPTRITKRFPRSAEIGAILLGKLAVDLTMQGRGLGRFLLIDALDQAVEIQRRAGAWAVVDAIDEEAAAFYEHAGFTRFGDARDRLCFALKDYLRTRG